MTSDSPLGAAISAEAVDVRRAEKQIQELRRQLSDAKRERDESDEARERAERELSLMIGSGSISEVPQWLVKQPKVGKHHGTPWLLLSDLHLDEVVNPAEIGHINCYNRKIATMRLKRTFENAIEITRHYWSGVTYDGIVAPLAGDLYAGDIHEELTMTNEDTMLGSILYWSEQLASGLSLLADEFGKVHVPVVVGNHGRRTRKPRAKFRARDNFDWFTGHLLARTFSKDKRITFDVSESADAFVQTYGTRVCITHGDQTSGGAGIGGIWPPIMRLDAKKRARQMAVNNPYDLLVMGHWHQLVFGPQFVINGSLVGPDEYSFVSNFSYQPPAQALWMMTPEHGRTWCAPIYPSKRDKEGW